MLRSGRGIGDISVAWLTLGKPDCRAARSNTAFTCAKPALPLATNASIDEASNTSVTFWRCASLFRSTTRPSSSTAMTVGTPELPSLAVARRMPIFPASGVTTNACWPLLAICACARFCPINTLPTAADAPALIQLRRFLSIFVSSFLVAYLCNLFSGQLLPELPVFFKRLQQPMGKGGDVAIGLAFLRIHQPVSLLALSERQILGQWHDQTLLLQGMRHQRRTHQRYSLPGDSGINGSALLIEDNAAAGHNRLALFRKPVCPGLTVIHVQQTGIGNFLH